MSGRTIRFPTQGDGVSKALHDLNLLVSLQGIYDDIARAITERKTPPPEIMELQETNRQRQAELEELEAAIAAHENEIRDVRKREEEWRLELEHFQKQKAIVSNEREFTAVISEIDYATNALNEAEARRTELERLIGEIRDDIEARRASRADEEEAQREVTEGWDARRQELRDRIAELAVRAKEIEERLAPKNRSRFLRLLESKRGTAMSEVVEGSCAACHISLRPHLVQRVRRGEEIIACESCHRILFLAENVPSGDA
jgi:predicted  nucleic acid-binding Zn-ribbon protein